MCPRRRSRDLSEVIEKTIENKVEDSLERRELEKEVLQEESTGDKDKPSKEEEGVLQKLISSFPSSQGYYGKLYKLLPSGNLEMKYYFPNLEDLQDPEAEIANLAKSRKWGSGTYKLRVLRHGTLGLTKSMTVIVDAEPEPRADTNFPPQEKIGDQLRNVVEIVNTAKELVPTSPNIGDPAKMGQVLAETFKAGVEAVKSAMPSPSNSSPKPSEEETLLKVITKLQEIGVIGVPKDKDPLKNLSETVVFLKQLGLVGEKRDDLWDQLTKLKAAGLVKIAGEEDTFSSVEKLKTLIDLVSPLVNPTASDKVSFAVEAVKVIGPHVPQIIENITSAIKEVADVSRMRIESSMGVVPVRKEIPTEIKPPEYRRPVSIGKEKVETGGRPRSPNPLIDKILESIHKKDISYFPKLRELIIVFVGPHVIEALITGQVSSSTFLEMVASYDQGIFNTPESKEYLDLFVNWIKAHPTGEEHLPGKIVGKCSKCGAVYDFEDEISFMDDSNRICDSCMGLIERVEENLPTSPLS